MRRFTLPNGMTVILVPDDRAPVVAFYKWVRVGSADETDAEAGLAHVLEHMLFKGTKRRGVGEIAQEIEGCGGDINAFTSFDTTVYYVLVASRFFDQGLDVLVDAVHHSIIDPDELALEKEVILEEIKRGEDQPGNRLSHALFAQAFKQHTYRRPVIGYRETVTSSSRDKVWAFYKKWYDPSNMVFVVAGDFIPREAAQKIRAAFKSMPAKGRGRVQRRKREPAQKRFRGQHVFGDAKESYFDLGFHIPGIRHKDVAPLDLLSVALGQGTRSRLVWQLKRSDRVTTNVSAYAYTPRDPGLFLVSGTAPIDGNAAAVRASLHEVFRIHDESIREEELDRARTSIEGDAVYETETVQGTARKAGFFETVGGDLKLEKDYYKAIASTTTEDIARVARKYLEPENLTAVTLAPEGIDVPDTAQIRTWARQAYKRSVRKPAKRRPARGNQKEHKTKLANGVTLVLRPDREVPIVAMRGVFLGGLRLEDDTTNGLSNLVARMWGKGTSRRSYAEILRLMDSFAGSVGGFAGYNSCGIRMEALSRHINGAVEVFADVLKNPTFESRELDTEKANTLQAIKSMEDHLSSYVMRVFTSTMYDHHPYRMSLLGTPELVSGFETEHLLNFNNGRAKPDNLALAVVGDFDPSRTHDLLARHLEDWRAGEPGFQEVTPPAEPPRTQAREAVVHKDREQAHLVVGFPGVTLVDPDRFALEVLSNVLAGQGGRLFVELRDREGLAYTVTAFSQEAVDPGYFAIYMATDPAKLERAQNGIMRQLERIRADGISAEELDRNARQLVGSYEIDLQKSSARAASLAFNERYGLGFDYYARYPKDILAVTCDDVIEAARKFLDFDRAVTAIIRPEDAARDAA